MSRLRQRRLILEAFDAGRITWERAAALMGLGGGISFGGKSSKQRNDSASGTAFNGSFLNQFGWTFGAPITSYDIMPTVGNNPTYYGSVTQPQTRPQPARRPMRPGSEPSSPYQAVSSNAQGGGIVYNPQNPVVGAPTPPTTPRAPGDGNKPLTSTEIFGSAIPGGGLLTGRDNSVKDLVLQASPLGPLTGAGLREGLKKFADFALGNGGQLPGDRNTSTKIFYDIAGEPQLGPAVRNQPNNVAIPRLQNPETIFTPGANAALDGLGFATAPADYAAPTVNGTTSINAPDLAASQIRVPRGNFDNYESAMYQSQFTPVAREIQRQGDIEAKQLRSGVANAGLGMSAAGLGLQRDQQREIQQRRTDASTDAANRASSARYQAEFDAAVQNAQMRQQANIERAGLDLQAQQLNAANILTGNLANADNYLKTIGLNVQQAQQAKDSFLQLMGLRAADVERMDTQNRANVELLLNNWLQQFGAVSDAGRFAVGNGASTGGKAPISILGGSAVSL